MFQIMALLASLILKVVGCLITKICGALKLDRSQTKALLGKTSKYKTQAYTLALVTTQTSLPAHLSTV